MLLTILKALGIKLTPHAAAQLEAFIPQVPAKVNEVIAYNAAAVARYDEKLEAITQKQILLAGQLEQIKEMLANGKRNGSLQRTVANGPELGN